MIQEYINQLNEAQRAPVLQKDGPMIVIAGAGSGKTRVLTQRIAWLISQGTSPFAILAITFTREAAGEMRRRLSALGVGHRGNSGPTVGTFHAVALAIT
mgnify:CR=1 FL=1